MVDMKTREHFRDFKSEMDDLISAETAANHDAAVLELFSQTLIENGETEQIEIVQHEDLEGKNRCKFDGICFNEAVSRCDLLVSLCVNEDNMLVAAKDVDKIIQKAGRAFRYAVNNQGGSRFADEALSTVEKIHESLDTFSTGRIIVCTNGMINSWEPCGDNVIDLPDRSFTVSHQVYDLTRYTRLNQKQGSLDDIQIEFAAYTGKNLHCVEEQTQNKDYDTYLAILSGDLIYQLFEDYGPRLYEFNVRSFLQARGQVNKGLKATLKNEPEKFLAYNNGLVITVEDLEFDGEHGLPFIKSVQGLQIVNGAQTTASIHRAKKVDGLDLSEVSVAAKITCIRKKTDKDFIAKISQFANRQNNIQIADLSANHPLHTEIERLAKKNWCPEQKDRWFYERARGSYQMALFEAGTTKRQKDQFKREHPPAKKFQKTDVAKIWHLWHHRPHDVSVGAQKNFNQFMVELNEFGDADWKPDTDYFKKLIGIYILFKATEKIVRPSFQAYRANISAYTVSWISFHAKTKFDYELVWQKQDISESLRGQIKVLTFKIDAALRESGRNLNITEWAKKEACWQELSNLEGDFKWETIPEFGGDEPDFEKTVMDEAQLVSWCGSLTNLQLKELLVFGQVSNRLKDIEIGVLSTLLMNSSNNRYKEPSLKQAKRARAAFEACESKGFQFETT